VEPAFNSKGRAYRSGHSEPQAFAVSNGLGECRLLHLEGLRQDFNHSMGLAAGESLVTASAGERLIIFDEDGIKQESPPGRANPCAVQGLH